MPNCAKLAEIALCMQSTSVECERSFSTYNRLKTKHRASIKSEKLNTLMSICMLGQSVTEYDPSPAIVHWLRKKKGEREDFSVSSNLGQLRSRSFFLNCFYCNYSSNCSNIAFTYKALFTLS